MKKVKKDKNNNVTKTKRSDKNPAKYFTKKSSRKQTAK